jgi:23S rRNA pseudouridine2605 synthase
MLEPLRQGITLDGERFQPMEVSIDRQQGANAWLTVGIREGRNREIRRALDHVGLSVNRLIRVSYGPFQLGTLKRGAVEQVKAKVLREQLGEDGTGAAPVLAPKPAKPARSGRAATPSKARDTPMNKGPRPGSGKRPGQAPATKRARRPS